ncbi:DUF2442 domain-containing protein [Anaerolineales bacterium HSG25]|nr:DUF2442 domain-containing protein [Anaerolineales bacterium HSG25]
MDSYPRIKSVKPLPDYKLLVCFRNDVTKIYDCSDLLKQPTFFLLRNKALFEAVQVDMGGYGISWNDELDLSEAELWRKGELMVFAPIETPKTVEAMFDGKLFHPTEPITLKANSRVRLTVELIPS